jgi:hypothetical protein
MRTSKIGLVSRFLIGAGIIQRLEQQMKNQRAGYV